MEIRIDTPLPFRGYLENTPRRQGYLHYPSILNFIWSERYRSVNETYRQYLAEIADPAMLALEVQHIKQIPIRQDWESIKDRVISCALWCVFNTYQDQIFEAIDQDKLVIDEDLYPFFMPIANKLNTGDLRSAGLVIIGGNEGDYSKMTEALAGAVSEDFDIIMFDETTVHAFEVDQAALSNYTPTVKLAGRPWTELANDLSKLCETLVFLCPVDQQQSVETYIKNIGSIGATVCIKTF